MLALRELIDKKECRVLHPACEVPMRRVSDVNASVAALSVLSILTVLLFGGQTNSFGADSETPGSDAATTDCLIAVEKYIRVIDSLMAPARNDAWHASLELQKHLPRCAIDEMRVLELAQTSRYFDHYQEAAPELAIRFRTTEHRQDFVIALSFDRNRRVILHGNARHMKKFID